MRRATGQRQALLRAHLPVLAALLSNRSGRQTSIDIPDADEFLQFAHRHSVGPSLAFLLDEASPGVRLPTAVVESLNAMRARQAIRSAQLLGTLQTVGAALDAAGIEWILLKGLGLAARYYQGLDRRVTRDIDVLVRSEDLTSAERVLARLGYDRASWAPSRDLALRVTHGFDYVAGDSTVDLHWALAQHVSFRFDLKGFWERRQTMTVGSLRVNVPGDEDALAFYLVSAFSDLQRRGLSARALVDSYRMVNACDASTDWDAFLERRRSEGTFAIAVNMLALLLDALDARQEFPAVAAAVARAGDIVRLDRPGHLALLTPGRYALANKRWALPLYDASIARSLVWWGTSLPLRFLVHRGWQDRRKRRALERRQQFRPR